MKKMKSAPEVLLSYLNKKTSRGIAVSLVKLKAHVVNTGFTSNYVNEVVRKLKKSGRIYVDSNGLVNSLEEQSEPAQSARQVFVLRNLDKEDSQMFKNAVDAMNKLNSHRKVITPAPNLVVSVFTTTESLDSIFNKLSAASAGFINVFENVDDLVAACLVKTEEYFNEIFAIAK